MPGADTWYPYWGADGRWYSSYTDGTVGGVHAQSGGSNPSMHGQVQPRAVMSLRRSSSYFIWIITNEIQ
jgi:hypothetical protein